ncbi:MAG: DUF4493 domain-containing protein [Pseudoflavonifractor sp.]|nr:DUF4493 domain-containing protein [Pseudoflavonifractor sp.]
MIVKRLLLASCGALLLAGCSDDKVNTGLGSGAINLEIAVDTHIKVAGDASTIPVIDIQEPSPDDFNVYITDTEGNKARWSGMSPSGTQERLLPGQYELSAISGVIGDEGFNTPCFYASAPVVVKNGETSRVSLKASLAHTLVEVDYAPSVAETFVNVTATLHSEGAGYVEYPMDATGPLFLKSGDVSVSLDATYVDGRSTSFAILTLPGAEAATYYKVTIEAGQSGGCPSLSARASTGEKASVTLTKEFFDSPAPKVEAQGFVSGRPVPLAEGALPVTPLLAKVTSRRLSHLYFTTIAPTLGSAFTIEKDLLALTPAEQDSLRAYGLEVSGLHKGQVADATIDFSKVVTNLRYVSDAIPSTFALQAVDSMGHVSEPLTLAIDLSPVALSIESVSDAVIGANIAIVNINSSSPDLKGNIAIDALNEDDNRWTPLEIISCTPQTDGLVMVTFVVPEGTETVTARLSFCGQEREVFKVERSMPEFTLEADPYALHVNVKVAATDPKMTPVVAASLQFFDTDGSRMLLVERHPEEGLVTISGLEAARNYRLTAGMRPTAPSPSEASAIIDFKTEAALQIPNADFEDIYFNALKYTDMPSGGRYSQNSVEIFNRQNHTSFDHQLPSHWATVNAKTFCRQATNINTWYLAPSAYTVSDAYAGAYAVRLDCVGYDIQGAPIPDYLQSSLPYTDYSQNIPMGYERAAGRLFLGDYWFDPANNYEQYYEGIPFESRPSSLNGAYKFIPAPADPHAAGIARIEVLGAVYGTEVVLASSELILTPTLSYTLFSIPLQYRRTDVKASSLRILFAASDKMGDMESETASISVTPFLASATLRGSSLWIDNLSLGY